MDFLLCREDFATLGMGSNITVAHRDVCADGLPPLPDRQYDAVFLDLPAPWQVVRSVAEVLKPTGRVCYFSPCLEQVHRTYKAMVETECFSGE
jgi:tRNA (adenine57-N1/adenine58-N1)-methyltransferase